MSTLRYSGDEPVLATIRVRKPTYTRQLVAFLESASYPSRANDSGSVTVSCRRRDNQESEQQILGMFLRTWAAMHPDAPLEVDKQPARRRRAWRPKWRPGR